MCVCVCVVCACVVWAAVSDEDWLNVRYKLNPYLQQHIFVVGGGLALNFNPLALEMDI